QLTMAPIQQKLIDRSILTNDEIDYINKYHEKVYETLSVEMKKQGVQPSLLKWLEINTKPL
ncbi:unnamed protein product, partial [Adineta steineri]